MSIETQQAVTGFIATDPRLTYTSEGVARLYCRIGIEHSRQEPDGSFTRLDPTFHDMTAFRKAAEEGIGRLRKGDKLIAIGQVHAYTYEKDGQTVEAEEFIVSRFGHDMARTRYDVDRAPRQAVEQTMAQREANGFDAPDQPQRSSAAPGMGM
ncbi:MAG: single-stranded DNA-binding protein [Actinomycetales bacterium]